MSKFFYQLKSKIKIFMLLCVYYTVSFSQQEKINILNANQTYSDQEEYPGSVILNGDVKVEHKGAIMTCKKALYNKQENILHAFGDVFVNQADTLTQESTHLRYNGNTLKAVSWGDVVVNDQEMTLTTDTLYFDREKQLLYYDCFGTIVNENNTLTSQKGDYDAHTKKFMARQNVTLVNEEQTLTTGHLDYYTDNKVSYLYGPSYIHNTESDLYTERGIYNTQTGIGYLLKNSIINHDFKEIKGDSLYYNKLDNLATGTGNVKITDTINNIVVLGDYGEMYRAKDSIIVTQNPVAISIVEKDSMYIHGDTLQITGEDESRLMKVYHKVKFFKSDLSGKCDSLVTIQEKGITEMFRNPVLWSEQNQITGDSIQLLQDKATNKLDSIKIIRNAFIVQKDSVGHNQIKGRNMFGRFENQKLSTLLSKGNGAVVNYARDEKGLLTAIMKMECSNILFSLDDGKIKTIQFLKKPEGKTYPPLDFPTTEKLLKGFIWREKERPYSKEDIFTDD